MKLGAESPVVQLKTLIVYCCPEIGQFFPIEKTDFPNFLQLTDVAISDSAEKCGWARKIAFNHKVFTSIDQERLLLRLNTYDLFLVYPLSLNTLAKFALGIQDSFPTAILFEAAALGKPILLNDQFIPQLDSHMNPHLVRIYRQHWENIICGTIRGFNLETLEQTTVKILRSKSINKKIESPGERQFITKDDVLVAAESLEPLRIPATAIITDLAREKADELGVIILQA